MSSSFILRSCTAGMTPCTCAGGAAHSCSGVGSRSAAGVPRPFQSGPRSHGTFQEQQAHGAGPQWQSLCNTRTPRMFDVCLVPKHALLRPCENGRTAVSDFLRWWMCRGRAAWARPPSSACLLLHPRQLTVKPRQPSPPQASTRQPRPSQQWMGPAPALTRRPGAPSAWACCCSAAPTRARPCAPRRCTTWPRRSTACWPEWAPWTRSALSSAAGSVCSHCASLTMPAVAACMTLMTTCK